MESNITEYLNKLAALKHQFEDDYKSVEEQLTRLKPESKIKLNTDEGQSTLTTNNMQGYLHSVLVDTTDPIDILVESELGYIIFKRRIDGIELVLPRARITPCEDNQSDILTFDKFKLNEKLTITVIGLKNKTVNLTFRLG